MLDIFVGIFQSGGCVIPVPIPYIVPLPYHYNPSRSFWLLEAGSEVFPHR